MLVVVVSLDSQATLEREVKRENKVHQGFLCQVPLDVQGLLVHRVHQVRPDLQAFPQEDRAVLLESLAVLVCRGREVTQENLARKVRRATPV